MQHLKQEFRNSRYLCTFHFGHVLEGPSHVCLVCPYFSKLVLGRVSHMWRGSRSMLETKHRAAGWRARAWKSDGSSQPSLVIISCFKSKRFCFLSIPDKTDDTPRTVVQEYTWRCTQRTRTSPGH